MAVFIAIFLAWPSYSYIVLSGSFDCNQCGTPVPQKRSRAFGGTRFLLAFGRKNYQVERYDDLGDKNDYVVYRFFADGGGSFTEEFYFQPFIALLYAFVGGLAGYMAGVFVGMRLRKSPAA